MLFQSQYMPGCTPFLGNYGVLRRWKYYVDRHKSLSGPRFVRYVSSTPRMPLFADGTTLNYILTYLSDQRSNQL